MAKKSLKSRLDYKESNWTLLCPSSFDICVSRLDIRVSTLINILDLLSDHHIKFQMSKLSTNLPSMNFLTLPLPSFSCLVYKYYKISQRRWPSRYKHFLNEKINQSSIKMKMKKLVLII